MLGSFFDSYYFGKIYIESADRDLPTVYQDDHEQINAHLSIR
ncbi:DUF5802 family protein [Haloquadratum walsbyi]